MFKVNEEKCIACKQCINDCPVRDILLVDGKANIKNEACFKCGHCVAICPTKAVSTDDYNMDDVKEYDKETFSIDPDNLLNFIKFRRSVRKFKNKEVEKEKINKIIEAGRFTQTATNSQDVSYIVVREKLSELRELAYETLKAKGEYILANLTPETEYLKRYAYMWVNMYNAYKKDPIKNDGLFFNAPAVIIVTANNELNAGLASTNMELMINALGLGTFYSGFLQLATQGNDDIMSLLQISNNKKVVTCIVLGYPAVNYKRTAPRKDPEISWI